MSEYMQILLQAIQDMKTEMNQRFDKIETKLDNLGEDVNCILQKVSSVKDEIKDHEIVLGKLSFEHLKVAK